MAKTGYMRLIALAITFMAIFFSLIKPVEGKGKRLKELQALQGSNYIITFGWKEFKRYVLQNPGDYQIILTYTVLENCDACVNLDSELAQVSHTYYKAGIYEDADETHDVPTFFARIEFNQENREAFLMSEFQSAPVLVLATKDVADQYKEDKKVIYDDKTQWVMAAQDVVEASVLIDHVNRLTGNKLNIRYTLMRTAQGTIVILAALTALFLLRDHLANIIQNRVAWFVGSSIVYIACVGGIAFSLIHSMPTFKYAQDEAGNLRIEEYFQRNQRGQYAGEGYMCSMLMFLIAAVLVAFSRINKMKDGFQKEAISLGLAVAAFFGFLIIHEIYILKSPHFNAGFFPPPHYMRGPYSVDQGTNI